MEPVTVKVPPAVNVSTVDVPVSVSVSPEMSSVSSAPIVRVRAFTAVDVETVLAVPFTTAAPISCTAGLASDHTAGSAPSNVQDLEAALDTVPETPITRSPAR